MRDTLNSPPLNPLPPVVWLLALPIIAMEVVLAAGAGGLVGGPAAIGWRIEALQRFAVIPDLTRYMWTNGVWPIEALARFVLYPFVQGTTTQAVFVVVILLALGKKVAEIFRWWAVLVIFFGASIIGALAFSAQPWVTAPLFGGYPGNYGLIGAFTYLLLMRQDAVGAARLPAFRMILFLLGAQLLFSLLFGGADYWVADLAGFVAGFALSFVVSPGGVSRLTSRLRQR